ncbi:MAG: glycosyltransferase family 4 protein [Actinomycetota bacterium]
MRVLLSCPYAWDAPGGVQVHVRELASRLAARGHDTIVLAPAGGGVVDDLVRAVGRPVRIPYGGKVAPICFSRASWRRIRRTIEVFEPDVVHAHEPFSPSTSMMSVLATDAAVVATFHAFHERSRLLEAAAPLLRSVARRIDAAVAVSRAAGRFVAPIVPGEVEIVPNGVDVERFARPGGPAAGLPDGRILLWVGRLDPQKGFPIMVRAFGRLATEFPDLSLVVAGDGRDRHATDLLTEEARRRVLMLGSVPNVELPAYLAAADVFASPATGHESFGIVLVEALAAGVPVVASDIPGYREVIRAGVDGLLLPPSDAAALASAIRRVLVEPDLASRLAHAGRARAREFSWDVVVPRIEAIYERVADRSNG